MLINKQRGENILESAFANSVFFIFLKKPTYLNSPIARIPKIVGIIIAPFFIIELVRLISKICDIIR